MNPTNLSLNPGDDPKQSQNPPKLSALKPRSSEGWRLRFVIGVLTFLALILSIRLFDMQVRAWQDYTPSDPQASARYTVDDDTDWGVIVDRDGVLMAADRYTYRVTATPKYIPQESWAAIAQILQDYARIPADQTWNRLAQNAEGSYVVLATNVDFAAGRSLLAEKTRRADADDDLLTYLQIAARPRRFYPQGSLASQVIGFLNGERKPLLGVERYYNSFLPTNGVGLTRGGRQAREVLAPETVRFLSQGQEKGLVLTLDRTIQWIIEQELREGVAFYGAEAGSIIVMDPKTGAILAMANWPTFDPNQYETEDANAFTNTSVSAQYEPGSVFKVITMAGALDAGVVTPSMIFTDTGSIVIGQRTIQNSNRVALGKLSVADALAQSNNVVTVQVAEALGAKKFYEYVSLFGFGQDTNIDVSGEISGLVKRPGDRTWSLSDLGTNSFGQGIAVTPIQMLSAVAAIANGGKLMRPYLVAARVHGDKVMLTQPTTMHQVLKPETAAAMREMMVHTITAGNQAAQVPGYTVGGKSGTAEIATEGGYNSEDTIASYVGFAPADAPAFVVLVKLDRPDPKISSWASQTAAPIFKRVAYRLLDHLNIPPDNIRMSQTRP